MYKVKNGKGKIIGEDMYDVDGVAVVYKTYGNGESFYPAKNQKEYIKGVVVND